jgi:predicted metal-dependent hydrolase
MVNKTLKLPNGEEIQYQLERRNRRTIGLKITEDGLVVHAPKRIFDFQLQKVLKQKANWVAKKLEARRKNYLPPVNWANNEVLQFLGHDITLLITANPKNRQPVFDQNKLSISLQKSNDIEAVKRKAIQWYKKQAMQDFGRRLEIFSTKLGVPTPPLRLSNAKSRWGSCTSKGDLRLNWRLLQAPPHIINYVICHELAHLKEMNHSAKFWAVVGSIFPDYKKAEKELKAISPKLHRL